MNSLTGEKAVVTKVMDLPFYTEGPAVDKNGNLYLTTLGGGSILKRDGAGYISEWAKSIWPNGQIILPNGDHLICDSKLGVVIRLDAKGKFIKNETLNYFSGNRVHSPNDLAIDPKGNIYFTDSIRNNGKVWLASPDGNQMIVVSGLDYPNGIAISYQNKCLYVAESYKNRILKIELNKDGLAADINVFGELPSHKSGRKEDNLPDGIAFDHKGNLWVAHYGMQAVQILSPHGKLLSFIDTTIPLTSNLFFVSTTTLFVTGGYKEPGPGALVSIKIL